MKQINLAIINASQLVTADDDGSGPKRGMRQGDLRIIEAAGIAVAGGLIVDVGTSASIQARHDLSNARVIDAAGKIVIPGLVDSHTHPIFGGDRCGEYAQRLAGKSLSEISAAGGGICSTITHTCGASDEALASALDDTLTRMLRRGTTTIEAKSGYGQTTYEELRQLKLIDEAGRRSLANVVPTFLGAHVPPGDGAAAENYIAHIVSEMLPAVAAQGIAKFCDVTCESGWFTNDQCDRVIKKGKELGLLAKFHVDAFAESGGWRQAAAANAVSADHLTFTPDDEIAEVGATNTVAVLLPMAELCYFSERRANARMLIDKGVPIAIASDFCSSIHASSLLQSLPFAAAWFRLTPEEVIVGATLNGAYAIGMEKSVGSLEVGKRADMLVLDVSDFRRLAYEMGGDWISNVIAAGKIIA